MWMFGLKIYLASMISFVISCRMGLDQNYWTILTCCVLLNPYSGMTRAKSIHRLIGTLVGGAMALCYAHFLANIPVLMLVVLGLTGGTGFAIALLDRTPRRYGFRIFAITLMLVALPSVDKPLHIFDTTVARVFEICVAVLCTSLVDSIIAPQSMRPLILKKIDKWLNDTNTWASQAFAGQIRGEKINHDRLKALADISAMTAMSGELSHDHMMDRVQRGAVFAIQQRLLQMVPLLSSIAHNLSDAPAVIREALSDSLLQLFKQINTAPHQIPGGTIGEFLEQKLKPADTDWEILVRRDLAILTEKVLRLWAEIRQLRAGLDGETGLSIPTFLADEVRKIHSFPLMPDPYLAVRLFWAFLLSFIILCLVWWFTGWAQMPRAILLSSITVGFFGSTVKTSLAIGKLGRFLLIIMFLTWTFCFGILPLTRDFPSFSLAMFLLIVPIGAWSSKNVMGRLILALGVSTMNLQNGFVPMTFDTFISSFAANFLGVFVAFSSLSLVRSMVTDHVVGRLLQQGRKDLKHLTLHAGKNEKEKYVLRGLNRISLFAAQLASQGLSGRSDRIMSSLLAGMSIADLRASTDSSNGAIQEAAEDLFTALRNDLFAPVWPENLLTAIDHTLSTVWSSQDDNEKSTILQSLIRLRLALFNGAPLWRAEI